MTDPIGLDSLFKEKIFRIPDYQRGFAWQKAQCKDFWEDLINLQPKKSHYTGVITLSEIPDSEIARDSKEYWLVEDHSYKVYNIVDGQQRLTSCIIFLQSLLEFIISRPENKGKSYSEIYITDSLNLKDIIEKFIYKQKPKGNQFLTYKFGYTADNPSYEYMRYRIFNEPNAGNIEETFYTLNLKNAKTYFIAQLSTLFEVEGYKGLYDIYKKVTKRLLFNEYIIRDDFDVFLAFETMNNRGKNLSKLELLKNRLIYLTTLYPDEELDDASRKSLRDDINDAWKEVYYQLGRNEKRPLNDDDFLKAHWIMSFKYSRKKGNDYINFLLNDYFTPKKIHEKIEKDIEIDGPEEEPTDFDIDDLEVENEEPEFKSIEISKLKPKQIKDYVNSLKSSAVYWFNSHFPLKSSNLTDEEKKWIDKLNRMKMGYFRPLVMSILKNVRGTEDKVNILKHIERYIFICFYLGQSRRNFGDSEFYNAAREIDNESISLQDLHDNLLNRENNFFKPDGVFNTKIFSDFIYKKFTVGEKGGFYNWSGLRYFLYEYELNLMKSTGQPKVEWTLFKKNQKDKISVEHIYPQTNTKEWEKYFGEYDYEKKTILRGSLGNLLLLSQSINSSLQNDTFHQKTDVKRNANGEIIRNGYANGSHSEIEVVQLYTEWTPEAIKNRSLKMLSFLESRWNIKLGNKQDKLDFMNLNIEETD